MNDRSVLASLFRTVADAIDDGMEVKAVIAQFTRVAVKPKVYVLPETETRDLASDCCEAAVVSAFDGGEQAYYKCIRCGSACNPFGERKPKRKAPEPEDAAPKKPVIHPCCGSRNWRHKAGCDSKGGAEGTRRRRGWTCDDCHHSFEGDAPDYEPCPKCGSDNTWPT